MFGFPTLLWKVSNLCWPKRATRLRDVSDGAGLDRITIRETSGQKRSGKYNEFKRLICYNLGRSVDSWTTIRNKERPSTLLKF